MFYGRPVILFHFLISMLSTFYSLLDCRSSVVFNCNANAFCSYFPDDLGNCVILNSP